MNQTSNYKLSQWVKSDQVRMEDFNADNAKIDAAIKAVDRRADSLSTGKADKTALTEVDQRVSALSTSKADKTALTAVEAKISRIVTGTYSGTGGTSGVRRIALPGRPKVVLIRTEYPNTSHHVRALIMTDICVFRCDTYSSIAAAALGNGYALEDNGFTVPANCDQNYSNSTQHYLAVI